MMTTLICKPYFDMESTIRIWIIRSTGSCRGTKELYEYAMPFTYFFSFFHEQIASSFVVYCTMTEKNVLPRDHSFILLAMSRKFDLIKSLRMFLDNYYRL